jgi:hypothetical protein
VPPPPAPQASRARAAEWLRRQVVDPNDPRNAELLELLRAREAAAGAAGQVRGTEAGYFNCRTPPPAGRRLACGAVFRPRAREISHRPG